jgi:phosphoheptose isomerase
MNNPLEFIKSHLEASSVLKRQTAEACAEEVSKAALQIADCFRGGSKILLCGNGGSAADCQHMAAEFVGRLSLDVDRPALAAVALTTDTSFITAYGNDFGDDGVFARQVQALAKPGDVLFLISTSGNSRNIIRAAEEGRRQGTRVISLTGIQGVVSELADLAIRVPSDNTQLLQEVHLSIEHLICRIVELELYGGKGEDDHHAHPS